MRFLFLNPEKKELMEIKTMIEMKKNNQYKSEKKKLRKSHLKWTKKTDGGLERKKYENERTRP